MCQSGSLPPLCTWVGGHMTHDMTGDDMTLHDMTWPKTCHMTSTTLYLGRRTHDTWHMTWHDMTWHDMTWHDTTYNMTWHDIKHVTCHPSLCTLAGGHMSHDITWPKICHMTPTTVYFGAIWGGANRCNTWSFKGHIKSFLKFRKFVACSPWVVVSTECYVGRAVKLPGNEEQYSSEHNFITS